jgi:hypothetical protein
MRGRSIRHKDVSGFKGWYVPGIILASMMNNRACYPCGIMGSGTISIGEMQVNEIHPVKKGFIVSKFVFQKWLYLFTVL